MTGQLGSGRQELLEEPSEDSHLQSLVRLVGGKFDPLTRSGQRVTMKQANVSELKAHLREYLARVRRGESVTVYDR
jgi:hypothetical protein